MSTEATIQVSVVIPAYNGAEYISMAVASALNQTHRDLEIIVVDDGSSDNTREVLEPYISSSSIRYHRQENAGHGAARNSGIRLAKGKYICFLDQDDWFYKESVAKRVAAYSRYQELGFIFSDFEIAIAGNGSNEYVLEQSTLKKYECMEAIPANCLIERNGPLSIYNEAIYPELILECFTWIGTVMIRREVFEDIGLFPENLRFSPDHDLLIRIARRYKVGFLDEITAVYRQHSRNMSLNEAHLYDEAIKIRVKYLGIEHGLDDRYRTRVRERIGDYYYRKGHLLIGTDGHFSSVRDFGNGIAYDPSCFRYYIYLLIGMLPNSVFHVLKKYKASLRK